jgi:hypothetical protein
VSLRTVVACIFMGLANLNVTMSRGETMGDGATFEYDALNLATASFKDSSNVPSLAESQEIGGGPPNPPISFLAAGSLLSILAAVMWVLTTTQSLKQGSNLNDGSIFSELANSSAQQGAPGLGTFDKILFYTTLALSGASPSPSTMTTKVGKGSKTGTRRCFTLETPDMKLGHNSLFSNNVRREGSYTLSNSLMPANAMADLNPDSCPTGQPMTPTDAPFQRRNPVHPGSKPRFTKHPGRKPQLSTIHKQDLYQEWDDDDWEIEPRAPAPWNGNAMDGEDVGVVPDRVLALPGPAVGYKRSGECGRSIFTCEGGIPKPGDPFFRGE